MDEHKRKIMYKIEDLNEEDYFFALLSVAVGLLSIFILSYVIIYAFKDKDEIRDEIAVDYKSHTDKYYAYFTPKQYHKIR